MSQTPQAIAARILAAHMPAMRGNCGQAAAMAAAQLYELVHDYAHLSDMATAIELKEALVPLRAFYCNHHMPMPAEIADTSGTFRKPYNEVHA